MAGTHGVLKIIGVIALSPQNADAALGQKRIGILRPLLGNDADRKPLRQVQGAVQAGGPRADNDNVIGLVHM